MRRMYLTMQLSFPPVSIHLGLPVNSEEVHCGIVCHPGVEQCPGHDGLLFLQLANNTSHISDLFGFKSEEMCALAILDDDFDPSVADCRVDDLDQEQQDRVDQLIELYLSTIIVSPFYTYIYASHNSHQIDWYFCFMQPHTQVQTQEKESQRCTPDGEPVGPTLPNQSRGPPRLPHS